MHTLISCVQIFLLLLIGGTTVALILLPEATLGLLISLALPLSTFFTAVLVLLYTSTGIPLSFVSLLVGHLALIASLIFFIYKRPTMLMDLERSQSGKKKPSSMHEKIILTTCVAILLAVGVFSFTHAVLLPTSQFDSLTNWTMRSKISFEDQAIAFDATEVRGMAKPQYPVLLHSLQILANQGQPVWNDTAANTMTYLLSISSFIALFLMIKKLRGVMQSVVTITSIVAIPLASIHLAQGYGDIHLLQYFLLSMACLGLWKESSHTRKDRWLVLSGVFVAASVWTKSEGLIFGLVPWLLTVGLVCRLNQTSWKAAYPGVITALVLSAPWPLFAWMNGLSLTPHSSDTMLQFHPEAVKTALMGLFGRGSFGIIWYGLVILVPTLIITCFKKHRSVQPSQLPLLAWGGVMFLEICVIYLATPNVRFLLNGESYYRQMMIPAGMLILGCSLLLQRCERKDY